MGLKKVTKFKFEKRIAATLGLKILLKITDIHFRNIDRNDVRGMDVHGQKQPENI